MRILYVAPMASVHSTRWVGYFGRTGHDVHAIDASFDGTHEVPGVTVHRVPLQGTRLPVLKYLLRYPLWLARWRSLVAAINPDVIHIHWVGLHALGAALSGFKPLVVTPWGSDLLVIPSESAKWRFLVWRVLASGTLFICDADHLQDELVRRGISRERVHVIAFGTDVAKYEPGRRDPRLAAELGFAAETPLIISLRALSRIYDIGTLISAVPAVVSAHPAARFVIVGDGPERTALQQQAERLGVANLVRFVGRLSDDDMVRYTASASACVSASLSDGGLAASTAEAMACGVPPVITDFGDNASWVEHGVTGFLFPCGDSTSLAARLIDLLSDRRRARQIGDGARSTIVLRNNVETEMGRVEQLYQSARRRSTNRK